jgi:hypothetical protein
MSDTTIAEGCLPSLHSNTTATWPWMSTTSHTLPTPIHLNTDGLRSAMSKQAPGEVLLPMFPRPPRGGCPSPASPQHATHAHTQPASRTPQPPRRGHSPATNKPVL